MIGESVNRQVHNVNSNGCHYPEGGRKMNSHSSEDEHLFQRVMPVTGQLFYSSSNSDGTEQYSGIDFDTPAFRLAASVCICPFIVSMQR